MTDHAKWITDWSLIDADAEYIVFSINARTDGSLYLGQPIGRDPGWRVRRYLERCYAALPMPPFEGLPPKETK